MLNRNHFILLFVFLAVFDFIVWKAVVFDKPNSDTEIYFLDVGQGDSELVVLPGGIKILIDAGPNSKAIDALNSILRPTERYIDLLILSHAEADHFNGFIDVLKNYQVGAFIYNGRAGSAQSWKELARVVEDNGISVIVLGQGDKIKYQNDFFEILSPNADFLRSKELNETGFVIKLTENDRQSKTEFKILFTGDIGKKVEKYLVENFDIKADILKTPHHGSKFSSSEGFLSAINPKIAAIEVGKNSYGHPTKEVLNKLALIGSRIFRTDQNGTIKIAISGNEINIFKKK
jgi:beta-lactamase superfamily II metal-dependent hydrolase